MLNLPVESPPAAESDPFSALVSAATTIAERDGVEPTEVIRRVGEALARSIAIDDLFEAFDTRRLHSPHANR